jgi:pyruvate dehydrogenase E1 component alpha subunit
MGTSQKRSSAHPPEGLAARAAGYGLEWDLINGEDVYEIRARSQIAIDRAHEESRPSVLEIATYRYYGHSVADANSKRYRSAEEIERYKRHHDPITLWQNRLIQEGVLDEDGIAALDKEAKEEAAAAARFAEASPFPELEDITRDVYWEVDNDTESGRTGRHFFHD